MSVDEKSFSRSRTNKQETEHNVLGISWHPLAAILKPSASSGGGFCSQPQIKLL